MTDDTSKLKQYHDTYVRETGLDVRWDMDRRLKWEQFAARFSLDDLATLIGYIQRQRKAGRPARSLMFRSLISGPESLAFAEEDIAAARVRRAPPLTPRDKIMQDTGRSVDKTSTAQTPAQIMAGNAALKEFLKVRDNL